MKRGADKPTIVDGKLANVSATQVKTFRMCPRKWYYTKVEKLPQKPTGSGALLGGECHERMERWLLTGEDVRGPIERHGHVMIEPYLQFAPFKGGPMRIEADVAGVLKTPGGVAVNGFIDIYIPTNPDLLHPVVIDHKFRKDLTKWAESEAALRDDEQFIIYGAFAALKEPNALSLEFRHHNHQTNARRNLPVSISAARDEVLEKFGALTKTIDHSMAPNAALGPGKASSVPYRNQACGAFGGCDFERQCPDSPRNRASANIFGLTADSLTVKNSPYPQEELHMGLMDQMTQAGTAPVVQKVEVAPAPKQLVQTASEPITENSLPLEPEKADEKPKRAKAPKKADEPEGLTLLVDCFSSRAQDITPWALDLAKQLAQRHGVQDIRVAPKESDLSYGGWRACIAAEAVKVPPKGVCYLAGSELTEPVIEALTGVATMVVRGRR